MSETAQASDIPALNKAHDRRLLQQVFARYGRIHIPAILTNESAVRVHQCLVQETPYSLVANSGDKVFDIPREGLDKLSAEEKRGLIDSAGVGAQRGFQFIYENFRLTDKGEPYPDQAHYHAKIVAFLNSQEFLSFARAVTGETKIAFADAQATRYGPGNFLTTHDDAVAGKNRVAAYVLNMTPEWRADWGGNLLFLNKDGHISEGYVPTFNALNFLRVPQAHCVSHVAPFAGAYRYSVTGWLRTR
jgi:Rps23 Pro-64 3,4-dihydroxylase Tpa1-like proline 4-hydroxylase